MLQNITLSAKKELIEKARQRAQEHNTRINSEFRRWLAQYAENNEIITDFANLMDRFKYVQPGKPFSRDELNER